jgi:hypothetical protein
VSGKRGKIKCLCYGKGLEEPELLVKNGKRVDQAVAFVQRADKVGYVGRKKKDRK